VLLCLPSALKRTGPGLKGCIVQMECHCVAILSICKAPLRASLCNRVICLAIDRVWSQQELLCNF
jgi:hypothetical protein